MALKALLLGQNVDSVNAHASTDEIASPTEKREVDTQEEGFTVEESKTEVQRQYEDGSEVITQEMSASEVQGSIRVEETNLPFVKVNTQKVTDYQDRSPSGHIETHKSQPLTSNDGLSVHVNKGSRDEVPSMPSQVQDSVEQPRATPAATIPSQYTSAKSELVSETPYLAPTGNDIAHVMIEPHPAKEALAEQISKSASEDQVMIATPEAAYEIM